MVVSTTVLIVDGEIITTILAQVLGLTEVIIISLGVIMVTVTIAMVVGMADMGVTIMAGTIHGTVGDTITTIIIGTLGVMDMVTVMVITGIRGDMPITVTGIIQATQITG